MFCVTVFQLLLLCVCFFKKWCILLIILRLSPSIPFVEGNPHVNTIPEGNHVCTDRDREIVLNCSFDEPDLVRTILWNIPESANVNLSYYPGHEVNNTMINKGSVIVTVNSSSFLKEYYECNVFYHSPRSLEVSNRFQIPLCMYSVLFLFITVLISVCSFQFQRVALL